MGSYYYIVLDEDGVREMVDLQVFFIENGKDNLLGSMDDFWIYLIVLIEKIEKDFVYLKKDVQKKVGLIFLEDIGKKVKLYILMQEVIVFFIFCYCFWFNVFIEEIEVVSVENNIFDIYLCYVKVDE